MTNTHNNNPIDADKDLHNAFGTKGVQTAPSPFRHPAERDIIKNAYELLNSIPAGQELIPIIKRYDVRIEVTIGRELQSYVTQNQIKLTVPKEINNINKHESALDLGLGLKQVELNHNGNQLVSGDLTTFDFRYSECVILMFDIASDFEKTHNHPNLIDKIKKLGYFDIYKLYISGTSKEVTREKIVNLVLNIQRGN